MCSSVCEYVLTLSWRSYSFALSHVRERSVCLSNTPIERSSMCAYVLSLSWTRSPGNPGTNQWSLVKGVGSFSKWGGGSNLANNSLTERGVFRKFICEHQQEKRQRGTAHPVMTVTQSGLGLLASGSSTQLPRALNRLPKSLSTM